MAANKRANRRQRRRWSSRRRRIVVVKIQLNLIESTGTRYKCNNGQLSLSIFNRYRSHFFFFILFLLLLLYYVCVCCQIHTAQRRPFTICYSILLLLLSSSRIYIQKGKKVPILIQCLIWKRTHAGRSQQVLLSFKKILQRIFFFINRDEKKQNRIEKQY